MKGLKEFEDEETVPCGPNLEIANEIKPVDVAENSVTSDVAHMSASTVKQGIKHQQ